MSEAGGKGPITLLRVGIGGIVVLVWGADNILSMLSSDCRVDIWTHLILFAVVAALFPEGISGLVSMVRAWKGSHGNGNHR